MNELSTKTLKLLLLTALVLFLGLLTVIFFLYEKEEPRIKKGSKSGELSSKVNSNSLNSSKFMSNSSSEVSTELVPNVDSLEQDAELIQEKIDLLNEMEIKRPEIKQKEFHSTFGRRIVFIYFSHTRESFLPYFKKGTAPESAYHSKVNISLVGNRLGDSLRSNGIWNDVSQVDIVNMLNSRNLTFGRSYQMSREVVVNELRENRDLEMAFDIHRDSLPREHSTIDIGGESLAKVSFVIGSGHENYKKNLDFTNGIHEVIEKKYPGLSRGVIIKGKSQGNGVYNQDLLPNSVIVEIGGVENNLEELYRSADILGNAISEYYWDKVHE
ncbi:stage II sporulation protein P [Metabacillus endolithicus]|uniref:Stage II sporulation protein P n=1 Tax=Metabacillus endolithicus TaxID=1535204 RepID=A0ABW5C2K7_9BACI|nr:stage II sporulation protein P [Metabacillus endolithicus]UPG62206.1 stage II sporulation protein P [Metabacillus endolithicus]